MMKGHNTWVLNKIRFMGMKKKSSDRNNKIHFCFEIIASSPILTLRLPIILMFK